MCVFVMCICSVDYTQRLHVIYTFGYVIGIKKVISGKGHRSLGRV